MTTARLLVAAVLASAFAAACEPQPDASAGVTKDDQAARLDDAPMSVTEVALTGGTNIPATGFDSVELRGGGHVILRYGESQRVTLLAGSTQYTRFEVRDGHRLVIDACNADCPMQYRLEIEIVTPHVNAVAIDGGGHIESAPGFPAQSAITAAVNGGGSIDLRSIDAESGTAAVSGGGKIHIRADGHLTAAVNGGGSIAYSGPAALTTAVNGGGSVYREDGGRG